MRPVVFIGPTLSQRRCSALLSAEYLPPARKGSLNEITPGRVVAIVDGEIPPDAFLPECEVRAALDRDVVLYGAASVGAYHASNLADHGMHGVGWVYDQYRAGCARILRRNSGHVRSAFAACIVGSSRQCSILAGRTDSGDLFYDQKTSTPFWKSYAGCRYPTAICSEDQEMYNRAFRPFRAKKIRPALAHLSRC